VKSIALVYQPYGEATLLAARQTGEYLAARSVEYELCSAHELTSYPAGGVRLAVCFGGDGTALRTARWLSPAHAPVVPVRMGKLSFLGELSPAELPAAIEPYLEGDFWLDERAMLDVTADGQRLTALNDAVLGRGETARVVTTEVRVDGARVVTYLADGVIVSTATGSTAYSLAAGGPVLAPQMRSMVVTPIAPHLTALKSLVLPADACVELVNRGHAEAILTVDGQLDCRVEPGASAAVTVASQTSLFARRAERHSFYQGLGDRLHRG
jgi:NAD+ kinase